MESFKNEYITLIMNKLPDILVALAVLVIFWIIAKFLKSAELKKTMSKTKKEESELNKSRLEVISIIENKFLEFIYFYSTFIFVYIFNSL